MESKNILITSISSKVPLINCVKDAKNKFAPSIKVYGADLSDNIIGKFFVDSFIQIPKIDKLCIQELIDKCRENNIGYIIPTRDEDVLFFAKYKNTLINKQIYPFVADIKSVLFCYDKLKFYEKSFAENVIPTFTNVKKISSENIVVKERYGAGSHNIAINISKKEALDFSKKLKNPIYQPYIKGDEFSIDAYVDKKGECIAIMTRSRDLIIGGEAKITSRVKDEVLEQKIANFLEKHQIYGHSVTQVIKKDKKYHIIECNARFGGASTLSYKLGIESFFWFLQECNKISIEPSISHAELRQVRIQKDIYFES